MPIIPVWDYWKELMKDKDKNQSQKEREEWRVFANYSESVRGKWFHCAFKLDFFQLMCKTFLIFKTNLETALTIILQ